MNRFCSNGSGFKNDIITVHVVGLMLLLIASVAFRTSSNGTIFGLCDKQYMSSSSGPDRQQRFSFNFIDSTDMVIYLELIQEKKMNKMKMLALLRKFVVKMNLILLIH